MSGSAPSWLALSFTLAGSIAGIFSASWLTSKRDRKQAERADRERDRAERRSGYLGLFQTARALERAIASGRGESALEKVRDSETIAVFNRGHGIDAEAEALVEAAERLVRVAAANPPASRATVDATTAFRKRLSALHAAMRADLAAGQEGLTESGSLARRRSLMSRLRGSSSSR